MKRNGNGKPMSIFRIPTDLLENLQPIAQTVVHSTDTDKEQDEAHITAKALARLQLQQERLANNNSSSSGSGAENSSGGEAELTCLTCRATFSDRQEQKLHFNTDWHRYNIKRKLVLKVDPVTYEEFEILLADLSESISGSEDSEEEEEEEEENGIGREQPRDEDSKTTLNSKSNTLDSLIYREKEEQEQNEQFKKDANQVVMPHMRKYSSLTWFKEKEPADQASSSFTLHYGIYRRLLVSPTNPMTSLQQLSQHQQWTIIMLGGGHFAGCVIDVPSTEKKRAQVIYPSEEGGVIKFIAHRTFHRYTTRRKQGGSQSANDNAKGAANSAGAQIRRYNEQALQQEVREVLGQWQHLIMNSQMVFVHAPSGNRKLVFNYEGAVLDRVGDRLNTIPFATRRPTLNELKRVYFELSTLKTMDVDEQALHDFKQKWIEKEEKAKKQLEKSVMNKSNSQQPNKAAAAETDSSLKKLLNLLKQNKTAVTLAFIEKNEKDLPLSGPLPVDQLGDKADVYHYPTLLHMVASMGNGAGELIKELLIRYDADPTIVSDAGKTAYEVCKDKEARNAFRRCMCDYPDKWDWLEKGRVPSPLTEKQEQEQLAKEKKRLEKEKERKRLMELEQARLEAEREAKEKEDQMRKQQQQQQIINQKARFASTARKLGSGNNSSSSSLNDTLQMSPEARMRLEREKRARAAEERMKRLQQQK
ncbi:hypothetical protein BDF20DRAFT_902592 [Mycotypha africana]|uniref:uncharacterized protein n=1 Tax=Mycotypha africana TaxID=64632 RepID=UPI0023005215|nr:uncharacterized protein BDF20DRAFT_902592 [Mycotypha africana]KAI8967101.1 hypothetical protein BDF20DRAFT_902592 [Mycotypha africana]